MPGFWACPTPLGPKTWHICSFPPCRQGHMCRNGVEPRDRPRPQSKTHFLDFTQNLALIFQFLPAPSSFLHPMNGETKCARFLGSPGPAGPENLAHLLFPSLHHSNGKAKCAGMGGTPRSAPTPVKNALLRKEYITQNLALIFQFLPAPSSCLHPMNGETKCARFLGSPGPAEPENLAHLLLPSLHHSNGKATCAGMGGTPRSAPTPIKNALFTERIYHAKSGPDFSIFARSLLLPTPNKRTDQMCQVFGLARARGARKPGTFALSLLAPQQRQGQMRRTGGEPRDRPGPQAKTHFLRKEDFTQNLALYFQFLPAPSSSLDAMNGETKCARFLGSSGPAEPENLAHLLLPSLHHSNGKAKCAGMGRTPRSAPNQKRTFYEKKLSLNIWP